MRHHEWKNKYKIIKQALENEISIDVNIIDKLSLKKNIAIFKIGRFKGKIPLLSSILLLPAIPFYYLLQIWISLKDKAHPIIIKENALFLSFTRSPKITELYSTYTERLPYIQCVYGKKLHFIKCLSFMQLLHGYFLALIYSLRFMLKNHPRYYLHSLNVLELVLFLLFLEKIKAQGVGSLTLTNHYDRWVTSIVQSELFEVNVIQHGMVDEQYSPKNKLKKIKSIRVLNDEQLKIFNEKIYVNDIKEVFYIKTSLNIDLYDRCEILIISNPFFIDKELSIYNRLKDNKFDVKFRPHPLYLNDKIKEIIDEKDLCLGTRLPAPTFSICRSSTLGNEYEMMGYKIIWWDDDTTIEQIITVVRG